MQNIEPPAPIHHLFDWHTLDDDVWWHCIKRTLYHQAHRKWSKVAHGKSLGMLFFNASLRTRTSMELAGTELGAHVTTLTPGQGMWGLEWREGVPMDGPAAEHIKEAIGVLSRYYDALGVRIFASFDDYEADQTEQKMQAILNASTVPVINLESAFYHPCQALADAGTLMTHFNQDVRGRHFVLTWAYHPKPLPMAVPNSALLMATRLGMHVTVAHPEGYGLDAGVMDQARQYAKQHGTTLTETKDSDAGYEGADVIYAKAWAGPLAYTNPDYECTLRNQNQHWRVTTERMTRTNNAAFMHCLPVRRGIVVDDAVLEGRHAIHLRQAEYRIHAQKAILEYIWGL